MDKKKRILRQSAVVVFLAILPVGKHFHVVTSVFSVFLRNQEPPGKLPPAPQFGGQPGVKNVEQFTWQQMLAWYSCTECGRCQEVCPAYASGLPLSPKLLIMDLRAHLFERGAALQAANGSGSGQAFGNGSEQEVLEKELTGDVIADEALWSCTTCYACDQECPLFVEHITPIVDMRRYLLTQQRADDQLMAALGNLRRYGNSFGQSDRKRAMWTKGLEPRIKDIRKALEDSTKVKKEDDDLYISKSIIRRASQMADNLKDTLEHWFEYNSGYNPDFNWWASDPYEKTFKALEGYIEYIDEKILGFKEGEPDPIIGDPIGRQALLDELEFEMIPYTPEELIEIGEQEYEWCLAELKRASQELGYGDDWHAAMEYVKTLHVEPGEQDDLIRDLANEAIAFLDEHDLVTIPELARETWRIEMMSERAQQSTPFFTYGGQRINVSYPTDGMTHEQKLMSMRGNNIHFSRATVQHELIPGHHLQGFSGERYRTWRRPFRTAFLGEGWCLHWEMLLWDMDFPQSPENRIGMLFWRIHRCARIIVSLKFHLGEMEIQEMIDFLVDNVGHEKDGATGEVRRYVAGSYGPLYQCAYLVGGLQLRALHRELVGSGRMTNREFHDTVLRENSIPVEMIRASLTAQELTSDFISSWRFMEELR